MFVLSSYINPNSATKNLKCFLLQNETFIGCEDKKILIEIIPGRSKIRCKILCLAFDFCFLPFAFCLNYPVLPLAWQNFLPAK